jgi:hypothetical protein
MIPPDNFASRHQQRFAVVHTHELGHARLVSPLMLTTL